MIGRSLHSKLMAVAASPNGDLLATSCKATSAEHAVIRIYDTSTWKQLGSPLSGHNLTIARIRFSNSGQYVLSCSRDRTWRLFKRSEDGEFVCADVFYSPVLSVLFPGFEAIAADRSHSRIVWDCAWAPDDTYFVTVSRDKQIKVWTSLSGQDREWTEAANYKMTSSATAIDIVRDQQRNRSVLSLFFYASVLD